MGSLTIYAATLSLDTLDKDSSQQDKCTDNSNYDHILDLDLTGLFEGRFMAGVRMRGSKMLLLLRVALAFLLRDALVGS